MEDLLEGTGHRAEDELDVLRRQVEAERFEDHETIRRFVDRYAAANPDEARTKSARTVADLLAQVMSELGLGPEARAGTVAVIGGHVRDLVLGRARASEDSSRWGVHHGAAQITMHSGQLVYEAEDVVLDGAGIDLRFRRTYKGKGFANGSLGVNWDHDYDLRLRAADGGDKIVRLTGSLRESTYTRHGLFGQHPAFNYWVPPPGEHSIVVAAGDLPDFDMAALPGCAYVLRTADGRQYHYEEDPGFADRYRLRSLQDRQGNYLALSYRPYGGIVGECLDRIEINCPHRFVLFDEYDESSRILCIRDHVGRRWRYLYDDFGDLIAATRPGTDRYPDGHTERYVYTTDASTADLQHRLTHVYDTAGRLFLENEYCTDRGLLSFGRVIRQREGRGERLLNHEDIALRTGLPPGEERSEEDAPAHQTVLVRRNGHPVHYIYNTFGNMITKEEEESGTAAGGDASRPGTATTATALWSRASPPEGRTVHTLFGRDVYMPVESPDVVGMNAGKTAEKLRESSSAAQGAFVAGSGQPSGHVVGTTPSAGITVPRHLKVVLITAAASAPERRRK